MVLDLQKKQKDTELLLISLKNDFDIQANILNNLITQIDVIKTIIYNNHPNQEFVLTSNLREFKELIDGIIFEIDYNVIGCIGNQQTKFKNHYHLQLYLYKGQYTLSEDIRCFLKDLIYKIDLCNMKAGSVTQESVKSKSAELKTMLLDLNISSN